MKNLFLFATAGIASGILFANLYTSLIDAKVWGSDLPHSITTAREYFRTTNPGNFFRIFSPINQLIALVVLILFWKSSVSVRPYLGAALLLYVLGDVLTFSYFYPRNDILFRTANPGDTALLKKTWSEWVTMNWIRSAIIFAGLVLTFLSIQRLYITAKN